MATGISAHEKHGKDALTAAKPHLDPHPLPNNSATAALQYPDKLPISEVLRPLPTSFVGMSEDKVSKICPNALVLADNIFALHDLVASGQRATLIYLDPPYETGMEFHSRQLEHAYKDNRGHAAYVEFMRRRLALMREALTDDGSIYIHIGHQMLFHLKMIMDEVFGSKNFRNLIVRRKCSSKNFTRLQYANMNDYILFYTKTGRYKWNQPSEPPLKEWIQKEYDKHDDRGQYKLVPIHAPGTRNGETGKPWRGMMPPPGKHWQYVPSKLDELDARGEIHWSKTGNPRRKVYLESGKRVPLTDYWDRFRDAHHQSIRITGYPTEKNLDMLRIIVEASSNPGDLVLDPFCGSGTTLQAADELGRRWIGIDESFHAMKASLKRLRHGLEPMGDYVVRNTEPDLFGGLPRDKKKEQTHQPAEFEFMVDSELMESHRREIKALAKT